MSGLRQRIRLFAHDSWRERLGPLWWYTGLLFGVNRLGDLVNIFIGLYLAPRLLPSTDLGALLPLITVGSMFALPQSLVLLPVSKFLSVFAAREEYGKVRALLEDTLTFSLVFTLLLGVGLLWQGDWLLLRLHVDDRRLLWPILGFAMLSCISPAVSSSMRALQLFKPMLWVGLLGPYVRLAGMLALLAPLGALGYLLAQLGLNFFVTTFSMVAIFLWLRGRGPRQTYLEQHGREMLAYALPLVAITIAGRIQEPIEALVIRHRLPLDDSAGYYYAFMFGGIPGFFSGAMMPFLWSLVSDRYERGQETEKMLRQAMNFNFIVGLLFVMLFAAMMPWFFTLPGPWQEYQAYSGFVWQTAFIGTLKAAQNIYKAHEMGCRRFVYMRYLVPLMLAESALLYVLPAWQLTRAYLPHSLWSWVATHAQPSLQLFVGIIMAANLVITAAMLIEWHLRRTHRTAKGPGNWKNGAPE